MENKKEKILRFRNLVSIPIMEAESYLSTHNWDIDIAVKEFKYEKIEQISDLTGESKSLVIQVFHENKLDFNKTVSFFKRKKEDSEFDDSRLFGLSLKSFEIIDDWIRVENDEGLLSAICMDNIGHFIEILRNNFNMEELANKIEEALNQLSILTSDDFTLEQTNKFKLTSEYKKLESQIRSDKIRFDEQLFLIRRNFEKK